MGRQSTEGSRRFIGEEALGFRRPPERTAFEPGRHRRDRRLQLVRRQRLSPPLLRPRQQEHARDRHDGCDGRQQVAVVHLGDEDRPEGDRERLRHRDQRVSGRGGPSLQFVGRPALQERDETDDDQRQAGPEDDGAREDGREVRHHEEDGAGSEQQQAEAHDGPLAQASDRARRHDSAHDGSHSLHGDHDTEERGGSVQPLADDGESDRLKKPDHEAGDRRRDHGLAQDDVSPQVSRPRRDLGPAMLLERGGSLLVHADAAERSGGDEERPRVDEGDGATAEGGEQPGAGQRPEQPQALADRLEEAVRITEQVVVQHRDEQA